MTANSLSIPDVDDVAAIPVVCRCGAYVGRIVRHKKSPYLDNGGMLISGGIHICHCCQRAFHWHGYRMRWEDFLTKYQEQTTEKFAKNQYPLDWRLYGIPPTIW